MEAEVKIFGSAAVQNKAKMLIDDALANCGQNNVRGGAEKCKKCVIGGWGVEKVFVAC